MIVLNGQVKYNLRAADDHMSIMKLYKADWKYKASHS